MLSQLPFFIIAAEEEHFERAARRLNIAQSALSRRIKALEEYVGVELFDRQARGVRLSRAGRQFFEDTRRVYRDFQFAVERVRHADQRRQGILRVGFNELVARTPLILGMLQRIRVEHPDIELQMIPLQSERQIDMVREGEINVGFAYYAPTDANFGRLEVGRHHYMLAMHRANPLARAGTVRLADLTNEHFAWIARAENPVGHDTLMEACIRGGLSPNVVCDARRGEDILSAASVGLAVGFVNSARLWHHDYQDVAFKPVEDLTLCLVLEMIWRRLDVSPALQTFIALGDIGHRRDPVV